MTHHDPERAAPARRPRSTSLTSDQRRRAGAAMHDLAGAGSSQVGIDAALRARDVNRPGEDDLAAAERDVVVVRRNWRPPQ